MAKCLVSGDLWRVVAGFFFGFYFSISSTFGIVVSDTPESHVVSPSSSFDQVGYLNTSGGTTGVLIGPWQILTAGHCVGTNRVAYTGGTFRLDLPTGPRIFNWTASNVSFHSLADLAVISLDPTTNYVGLAGYGLYTGTDEAEKTGTLVGYGMSGTGTSTTMAGGDPNYPRGTKRVGSNKIDSAIGSFVKLLEFDFDAPSTIGQPNGSLGATSEVMVAAGDSGGPTFIDTNGTLAIAGIHYGIVPQNSSQYPRYGDRGRDVRVSSYAGWISGFLPLPGDTNNDKIVNFDDYATLCVNFGKPGTWLQGDFDLNGVVDFSDYATLKANFGRTKTSSVPEPGAILLLLAGGLSLLRRFR